MLGALPGAQPGPGGSKCVYAILCLGRRQTRDQDHQEAGELGCVRPFPMNSGGFWIIAIRWLPLQ